MRPRKTTLREIVKLLCLTQYFSMSAKEYWTSYKESKAFYNLKYQAMLKALDLVSKHDPKETGISYFCEESPDQNGYPSIITYFDIIIEGAHYQMSFHTPYGQAKKLFPYVATGRHTKWVGHCGVDSAMTAVMLNEHYRLGIKFNKFEFNAE